MEEKLENKVAIRVQLKDSYCNSFSINCLPKEGDIEPLIDELFDLNDFIDNYSVYYINNEGYLKKDIDRQSELDKQKQIYTLRLLREQECFPIINRGQLWYGNLTEAQLSELQIWYQAWLDVTETLVPPEKPNWINKSL